LLFRVFRLPGCYARVREFTHGGTSMTVPFLTLGTAARSLGVRTWQLRRLFERGLMPEPPRVGVYRVIAVADLPGLKAALQEAGYLREVRRD
jgi:hypothetical protein